MLNIIYLGTSDFAVPALQALIEAEDITIPLVISQPDRKRSRNKWSATPVKEIALGNGLPIITPEKINRREVIDQLIDINPDFLVVIAYGQIIGQRILDAFPDRIINIHGSLLPEYRGAAPMQRAMLDGKKETGITSMLIRKEMDAGPILKKVSVEIENHDDLASLTSKLATSGADLLLDTLRNFDDLNSKRQEQDPNLVTYAAKITREDGYLDFDLEGERLLNQVRTLKDGPGVKFDLNGISYKVHDAHLEERNDHYGNGIVWRSDDSLAINASDKSFVIDRIQAPNKRAMPTEDFLRGNPIEVGSIARKPE